VSPGSPNRTCPTPPNTWVLSTGRALVGPAGEPADLGPGDYISYPGDAPHIFKALEPDTTAVMIMEHI
jgi:quercetin dioxygenase-like cupin family protein